AARRTADADRICAGHRPPPPCARAPAAGCGGRRRPPVHGPRPLCTLGHAGHSTMKLKDAVILITGSGTGVGAACARQFAAKGARIVVNYSRSQREAEETAAGCAAQGVEVEIVKADVADDAACRG